MLSQNSWYFLSWGVFYPKLWWPSFWVSQILFTHMTPNECFHTVKSEKALWWNSCWRKTPVCTKNILNFVFDSNILFWYENIIIAVNSSLVNKQYSKVSMPDVRKYFVLLPQVPVMIISSYDNKQHKECKYILPQGDVKKINLPLVFMYSLEATKTYFTVCFLFKKKQEFQRH